MRPYLAKFAAYYYNESQRHGQLGIISYKWWAMQEHSGLLDLERGQLDHIRPQYWQTDTSVSNKSWGYIEHDTFKSPLFIIDQLADVVSKNGNLLMNIGPRADGTIPEEVQKILLSVGSWLQVNGEGIYGTRPWRVYGEGPTKAASGSFNDDQTKAYTAEDFRFTTKGNLIYGIELGWPATGKVVVHSITAEALGGRRVQSVSLLGSPSPVHFMQIANGLQLELAGAVKPAGESAYVFRITLNGDAAPVH